MRFLTNFTRPMEMLKESVFIRIANIGIGNFHSEARENSAFYQ